MVARGSNRFPQSLQDYHHQLLKANLIESSNPHFCLELLENCLKIIQSENHFEKTDPKHIPIITARVKYLKTFPKDWFQSHKISSSKKNWKKTANVSSSIESDSVNLQTENFDNVVVDELNSDNVEPNSLNTDSIAKTVEIIEKRAVSPIFDDLLNLLFEEQEVSYEQYLMFYQELNQYFPKPLPTIVRDNRNMIYYIGDTHGSYAESRIMLRYFEKILDKFPSAKFVFLGDYVDRNPKDLENLTLIIAFAIHYPDNVVLLRGNHEDLTINQNYGFYKNLEDAFIIDDRVKSIYKEILDFFMKLTIVHLDLMFDSQNNRSIRIMAVHGGIPVNVDQPKTPVNLENLEKVIKPQVETYTKFDRYMNWLLWADPKEELKGVIYDQFTGRSQFGPDAFDNFMIENKSDFMVRAHERFQEGIGWFFNHRLVSLFTTSFYNGIRIGNGKFLRLQPGKGPAILPLDEEKLNQDLEVLN